MTDGLPQLSECMQRELTENILPFWPKYSIDRENGGFYGALTNDLRILNDVERSLVQCARMLWTYSAAYRKYQSPTYLDMALHAYSYLTTKFLDPLYGGMYWQVDTSGNPINDRKQTYGQAFAIYGLTEFFLAAGDLAAIDLARRLFDLIELHAFDPVHGGYIEGCARNWEQLEDMRLSDKEPYNCPKSMNTMLHVIEGYTNLLRAWPNPRLLEQQTNLVRVFLDKIVDPQTHATRLFFEQDWRALSDHISYGHDIETSWLLVEAAEVLNNYALVAETKQVAVRMAEAVYQRGLDDDGAVLHEGTPREILEAEKHWWCQAEGIVGFVNAYQISGDEKYARAACCIWDFIDARMIDHKHGEWFKVLDRSGSPVPGQRKAGPWEDPYHHARACMEIQRRIGA